MSALKPILIALSGIVGVGAPTTVTAYYKDHQSIWDESHKDVLPNSKEITEEDWNKLKSELASASNITDQKLLEIKKNEVTTEQRNALKDWCVSAYSKIYRSLFKEAKYLLLADVEATCILTIDKKLGSDALSIDNENDKNIFVERIKELKSHDNEEDGYLNEGLSTLRDEITSKEDSSALWEKLRDQCKAIYKLPYQDKESNDLKLANKFCRKTKSNLAQA